MPLGVTVTQSVTTLADNQKLITGIVDTRDTESPP